MDALSIYNKQMSILSPRFFREILTWSKFCLFTSGILKRLAASGYKAEGILWVHTIYIFMIKLENLPKISLNIGCLEVSEKKS